MTESLGKRISKLRKKKNMTQRDLAERIEMSISTIAMWETGNRDPDSTMISKLASIFDVTTDYLLGRDLDVSTQNTEEFDAEYHKIERFARKASEKDLKKALNILEAAFEDAFNEEEDDQDF